MLQEPECYISQCFFQIVRMSEIGDVVILDVDANELRTPFHDLESLPPDLVSFLLENDIFNIHH